MTRMWQEMKEITGKSKFNSNRIRKSININGKSIKKNSCIAEEFNKYLYQYTAKSGQQDTKHI